MARLSQAPMTPRRSVSNPDSLTDLNRLLARLQQSILQADAERERRLRTSEYERNKVGINLEYARTLLTKLEHDAVSVKVHSRRQEMQADLNRKRDVFEQLTERLRELEEISIDSDEDSSDGEDLLGDIIQTPSDSMDSRSPEQVARDLGDVEEEDEEDENESTLMPERRQSEAPVAAQTQAPAPTHQPKPEQPGTATTQTMRSRGPGAELQVDTADTSGRKQLFGNRTASSTTAVSTTATTEAILDHQRAEQDKLTESMLNMARSLKSSSHAFQTSLDEEKDVLSAAGSGLEKNERGLEQATRRVGALRSMSEGKGWFGRMLLYAWIFGMMVVAILIVFVLPKLRF